MIDLACSLVLLVALASILAAYAARVVTLGHVRFARVDAAGSSFLLGKTAMQMVYWALSPIGDVLAWLGVSANAITRASFALGALAGVALAYGHFGVAAALSAASALSDALDGMVARASNTVSTAGKTLDSAVDRYNEFFFLGGLALFYRSSAALLGLALLALIGSFMVSYASAVAEGLRVSPPRGSMRRAERATYLTAGAALVPLAGLVAAQGVPGVTQDLPIVIALFLVAAVANVSAAHRLIRIAELAGERDPPVVARRIELASNRDLPVVPRALHDTLHDTLDERARRPEPSQPHTFLR
jgi:CDP-diacylglycerol---glycerol-3-phosphate 3-phosphatidyltransferase